MNDGNIRILPYKIRQLSLFLLSFDGKVRMEVLVGNGRSRRRWGEYGGEAA